MNMCNTLTEDESLDLQRVRADRRAESRRILEANKNPIIVNCGYTCKDALIDAKELWAEGLISMHEFSDRVSSAILNDDHIPF